MIDKIEVDNNTVNRKLIRTTLAEIKEREAHQKDQGSSDVPNLRNASAGRGGDARTQHSGSSGANAGGGSSLNRSSKRTPPAETNAEIFYYKKQMDSHTPMVIVLQDGEEIEGTIEWYDRSALKINRLSEPNILLLKHNIKYMYKAEDRQKPE
ncbi:MAG: hypothetical protein H0V88_02805 [Pyrinomonadaceae bacterium]|nr:hypothetical protein [Pyrinomonadaceae bacterium]